MSAESEAPLPLECCDTRSTHFCHLRQQSCSACVVLWAGEAGAVVAEERFAGTEDNNKL